MLIKVSIGEFIDRLSILELKKSKIKNTIKLIEINKEIEEISKNCDKYKKHFYYKVLLHINEQIWEKKDKIKNMNVTDSKFSYIANDIFDLNIKRVRIKNIFNILFNSNIKEESYHTKCFCKIIIDNQDTIYNKIPEINYLLLCYDNVYFEEKYKNIITKIFPCPTILFNDEINIETKIEINNYQICFQQNEIDVYEFEPINYISNGLLGDFIFQLSVINEKFLETGRKGMLYISKEKCSYSFRFGTDKTYQDTYPFIINQNYIKDYKIQDNQTIEYNLSSWRNRPDIYETNNWYDIFKYHYNIEWGTHPWLTFKNININPEWKDLILINTTPTRTIKNIDFKEFYSKYIKKNGMENKIRFLTNSLDDYEHFKKTYDIDIPVLHIESLLDSVHIISNSKLFIGSLSAYLTMAIAVHKIPYVIGLTNSGSPDNIRISNLKKYLPNIIYEIEELYTD